MAGHSQFKNIMHRKGRQDKVRSKLFGKLAREITVSAKLGLPDPTMNARLRAAILAARAENMPKDGIERAIKKAAGHDAEHYDEIRYEGYGPGGAAIIVEVLTDNRNRTAGDVRATFTKAGGNLAETGAVSFMFDHVGVVEYDAAKASADAMLEAAIEAGAEDVVSNESGHEIYTTSESLAEVGKALEALLDRLELGLGRPPFAADDVRRHLGTDKKHAAGRLRWVLPTADGVEVRTDVPEAVIETVLADLLAAGPDHGVQLVEHRADRPYLRQQRPD